MWENPKKETFREAPFLYRQGDKLEMLRNGIGLRPDLIRTFWTDIPNNLGAGCQWKIGRYFILSFIISN